MLIAVFIISFLLFFYIIKRVSIVKVSTLNPSGSKEFLFSLGLLGAVAGTYCWIGKLFIPSFYFVLLLIIALLEIFFSDKEIFPGCTFSKFLLYFSSLIYFFYMDIVAIAGTGIIEGKALFTKWSFNIVLLSFFAIYIVIGVLFKENAKRKLNLLLLTFQIPLPLLLLQYKAYTYQKGREELYEINLNAFGQAILYLLIAYCFYYCIRQIINFLQNGSYKKERSPFLTTTAVILAVYYVYYVPPTSSFSLYFDNFHLGEKILPWHQIYQKGLEPYWGYAPVRGMLGVFHQAVNWLFLSGQFATFEQATAFTIGIFSAITALIISLTLGAGWGILFSVSTVGIIENFLLIPLVYAVVWLPLKQGKALRTLSLYVLSSLIHILLFAGMGVVASVALSPLFLTALLIAVKDRERAFQEWQREKKWILLEFFLFLLLLVIFYRWVGGTVWWIFANKGGYLLSHGIPLTDYSTIPSWLKTPFVSFKWQRIYFEFFRIGIWVITMFLVFFIGFKAFVLSKRAKNLFNLSALSLSLFLLPILLAEYTLGRIDANVLSRTGLFVTVYTGTLFPLLIAGANRIISRSFYSLILGIVFSITLNYSRVSWRFLLNPFYLSRDIPQGFYLYNDLIMGKGYFPAGRVDEIQRFRRALKILLNRNETYFDAANQSALYYFSDKKVSAPVTAFFVASNEVLQRANISKLEENPPSAALTAPVMEFDSSAFSLRSYRVYRWLLLNGYRYGVAINGFKFLIKKDRKERLKESKDVSFFKIKKAGWLYKKDIGKLAEAWGQSFKSRLYKRFEEKNKKAFLIQHRRKKKGASFIYKLNSVLRREEADFILLEENLSQKLLQKEANYRIIISWGSSIKNLSGAKSLSMRASKNTQLLIPVGSHPLWLLNNNIKYIKIRILPEENNNDPLPLFSSPSLTFLKLVR